VHRPYGHCLQSKTQPIFIQLVGYRSSRTICCIERFGLETNHDAFAIVVLPHIDWHMPAEVVNVTLKIQITATIFVYHFVYPNGTQKKKCMHANELD
jgi:hypothetical protein